MLDIETKEFILCVTKSSPLDGHLHHTPMNKNITRDICYYSFFQNKKRLVYLKTNLTNKL